MAFLDRLKRSRSKPRRTGAPAAVAGTGSGSGLYEVLSNIGSVGKRDLDTRTGAVDFVSTAFPRDSSTRLLKLSPKDGPTWDLNSIAATRVTVQVVAGIQTFPLVSSVRTSKGRRPCLAAVDR